MEQKNLIIIIIALVIVLAVTTFVYLAYIADYTFEDERIRVTVPAQTQFNINASKNDYWTFIRYNSSDNNNITIDLIKPQSNTVSFFGIELDVYETSKKILIKEFSINQNFTIVGVTDNYTIYYNKEKNRYAALIFDDTHKVIIMISCDNSKELIEKLAKSFVFISFDTTGLDIAKIDENNTSSNGSRSNSYGDLRDLYDYDYDYIYDYDYGDDYEDEYEDDYDDSYNDDYDDDYDYNDDYYDDY